jgi:protein ImuA
MTPILRPAGSGAPELVRQPPSSPRLSGLTKAVFIENISLTSTEYLAIILQNNAPALADLRSRLKSLGGLVDAARRHGVAPLGLPAIDGFLPAGGLARGRLHGIAGEAGATTAFALFLLGRLAQTGVVLWCAPKRDRTPLYPPAMAAFGLDPARLWRAQAADDRGVLEAMEDGLRSGALAAVLGEAERVGRVESRRLQLAAETSGTSALCLGRLAMTGVETTRWHVAARPSSTVPWSGLGRTRWRVTLERGGGQAGPRGWLMEHDDATHDFAVVAPLGDRPAHPPGGIARDVAA